MTNAPYLLPKARAGYRMGHGEILDHMFYDGLQSPWDGKLMGCFADATASRYAFTRAEQGRLRVRVGTARGFRRGIGRFRGRRSQQSRSPTARANAWSRAMKHLLPFPSRRSRA
jgi:hypothetical protein